MLSDLSFQLAIFLKFVFICPCAFSPSNITFVGLGLVFSPFASGYIHHLVTFFIDSELAFIILHSSFTSCFYSSFLSQGTFLFLFILIQQHWILLVHCILHFLVMFSLSSAICFFIADFLCCKTFFSSQIISLLGQYLSSQQSFFKLAQSLFIIVKIAPASLLYFHLILNSLGLFPHMANITNVGLSFWLVACTLN